MSALSSILLPLFACILVGWGAGLLRVFGAAEARVLSRFVFLIAFPPAVLDFMRRTEPPGLAYAGLILAYVVGMAVTAGVTLLICKRFLGLSTQDAGGAVFACVCGNAVFLGLPIALSVDGWAPPFLILMLFEGLLAFALGTALMTWPAAGAPPPRGGVAGNAVAAGLRAARNPVFAATLVGLILTVGRVPLPVPLEGFLDLFGAIAGPAGLFVLGLYLAILPREHTSLDVRALAALLPIRLVFFPALTGGLAWLLTGDAVLTAVALLFTALPPAVASVVQSSHYGRYEAGTAALVASGTIVGLVTTTLLLGVLLAG